MTEAALKATHTLLLELYVELHSVQGSYVVNSSVWNDYAKLLRRIYACAYEIKDAMEKAE